jgi:hypothetical protein
VSENIKRKSDSTRKDEISPWKVLLATFVALASADLLRSRWLVPDKQAVLLGLLLGLLAQQAIPPRLSLKKILTIAAILCLMFAIDAWLHW